MEVTFSKSTVDSIYEQVESRVSDCSRRDYPEATVASVDYSAMKEMRRRAIAECGEPEARFDGCAISDSGDVTVFLRKKYG